MAHLPEDKVFGHDALDGGIAPDVPVEHLAGKLLHILYIHHQPAILCPANLPRLMQRGENVKQNILLGWLLCQL